VSPTTGLILLSPIFANMGAIPQQIIPKSASRITKLSHPPERAPKNKKNLHKLGYTRTICLFFMFY
jgi:hypothetical protein